MPHGVRLEAKATGLTSNGFFSQRLRSRPLVVVRSFFNPSLEGGLLLLQVFELTTAGVP